MVTTRTEIITKLEIMKEGMAKTVEKYKLYIKEIEGLILVLGGKP